MNYEFLGIASLFLVIYLLSRKEKTPSSKTDISDSLEGPRLLLSPSGKKCEIHNWEVRAFLDLRPLKAKTYTICSNCGALQGEEFFLSKEGLEVVEHGLERIKKSEEIRIERERRANEIASNYLTDYLIKNFPEEVNDAQTLKKLEDLIEFTGAVVQEAKQQVLDEREASETFHVRGSGNA